ncbi:MAG: hypothetical protein K9M51_04050 [Candidatus Gracilibacteria bacterium]|nr:hypothetical protein [Candidatus Gracilibacteria bacterium]
MSKEQAGNLEDLLMGNVSEGSEISDEKISERLAAAQARLSAVQRDEKKARGFDRHLAQVIKHFSPAEVEFVAFLLDRDVPSLTILSMFSLGSDAAGKAAFPALEKTLPASKKDEKLPAKVSEKISLWWRMIVAADAVSTTTKLSDLHEDKTFASRTSKAFAEMLHRFLNKNNVQDFDSVTLKKMLQEYEKKIFRSSVSTKN